MDICEEHGDGIAYAAMYCPACSQIEDLQNENSELEDKLVELEEKLEELSHE